MGKRGLGAVRLSVLTDETTSPERQEADIERIAAADGLVAPLLWARDLDVSATRFGPMQRDELAPFLTDPALLEQYDTLFFWKLDRFVRKVGDFWDMIRWADQTGKVLRSATESMIRYDPNATGMEKVISQVIATLVAGMAEMEAFNTSFRVRSMKAHVRLTERWSGEAVPLGYEPARHEKGYWTLVKSSTTFPLLEEIVNRLISGETVSALGRDFNARGIPSLKDQWRMLKNRILEAEGGKLLELRGNGWTDNSIRHMFRSPVHLGWAIYEGEVLLDEETGLPVQRYEPLMTLSTWKRLQAALARRSISRSTEARCSNPLRDIAWCAWCGAPFVLAQTWRRGRVYRYLSCAEARRKKELRSCIASLIPIQEVTDVLEARFLAHHGADPVVERVFVPAEDHTEELSLAAESLEALVTRIGSLSTVTARKVFDRQIAALEAKISYLESLPNRPARHEWRETGQTNEQQWASLQSWEDKRELLHRRGIVLMAAKPRGRELWIDLEVPQARMTPAS